MADSRVPTLERLFFATDSREFHHSEGAPMCLLEHGHVALGMPAYHTAAQPAWNGRTDPVKP
jgi:hypothetical protein